MSSSIPASYIVYTDGQKYHADPQGLQGLSAISSTNAATVINAALAALASLGGNIFVKAGNYNNPSVTLVSGISMILEAGVTNLNPTVVAGSNLQNSLIAVPRIVAFHSSTGNAGAVTNAINYIPETAFHTYRMTVFFFALTATSFSIDFQLTYRNNNGANRTVKIPGVVGGTSTVLSPFTNTIGSVEVWGSALFTADAGGIAITLSTVGTFTTVSYTLAAVLEIVDRNSLGT